MDWGGDEDAEKLLQVFEADNQDKDPQKVELFRKFVMSVKREFDE